MQSSEPYWNKHALHAAAVTAVKHITDPAYWISSLRSRARRTRRGDLIKRWPYSSDSELPLRRKSAILCTAQTEATHSDRNNRVDFGHSPEVTDVRKTAARTSRQCRI
jgi:hypothetical protein